jgi:predicted O-methyltransferase YrrM
LRRNDLEGHQGKYFGTDINPAAGYYLQGEYGKYGEVIFGDSLRSLEALHEEIDLFINDSDHSADYEQAEYEVVRSKLAGGAIVLGDNSHVTSRLAEFSMRNGRGFVFLSEEPADHWYRGAGVGISFPS